MNKITTTSPKFRRAGEASPPVKPDVIQHRNKIFPHSAREACKHLCSFQRCRIVGGSEQLPTHLEQCVSRLLFAGRYAYDDNLSPVFNVLKRARRETVML